MDGLCGLLRWRRLKPTLLKSQTEAWQAGWGGVGRSEGSCVKNLGSEDPSLH